MYWDALPEYAKGQKQNKNQNKKAMPNNILHQKEELFVHSMKYIEKPPIVMPKQNKKKKTKPKQEWLNSIRSRKALSLNQAASTLAVIHLCALLPGHQIQSE